MKRRSFLGAAGSAAFTSGLLPAQTVSLEKPAAIPMSIVRGRFTLKTFQDIHKQYRYDFDDFLTFFDKFVVDRQYGGFMLARDHDGTRLNTNKSPYDQGRGIWCYSFM